MTNTPNYSTAKPLEFIGLHTRYKNADGSELARLHLDGAASPLACKTAIDTQYELLPHYSNTHSHVHNSAKVTTNALAWAHDQVLSFVGASEKTYTSIFIGAGTTAAINRIARGLATARPSKKVVLVSSMEHHANDLPHRQFGNQVHYIPLAGDGTAGENKSLGAIDLTAYEALLKAHSGNVNYVAVSSVSNVTGIKNPIAEMTRLAHQYDALIVVDGAQSVAHETTLLNDINLDFFIFSGHKVYAPSSPGVLIAKLEILKELSGQDLGGGSVSTVSYYDYQLSTGYPDREQSGTPNIVGAIALASVLKQLREQPMSIVAKHAHDTMSHLVDRLKERPSITVYGDERLARVGALAFNHQRIDHGLLAAILNDYYGIAVRNECFCAHPYVSSLLKEELWALDLSDIPEEQQETYLNRKRGMVRVSISLYTSKADIDRLVDALDSIEARVDQLRVKYNVESDGSYRHKDYELDWRSAVNFTS